MDEQERAGAESLLIAIRFQERVLKILDAGFDQLTTRETELLDACWQVYAKDLRGAT